MLRFNVFGKLIGVEHTATGWNSFYLGEEGKRRPADFVVPEFIEQKEMAIYLRDIFHESASHQNPDVTQL